MKVEAVIVRHFEVNGKHFRFEHEPQVEASDAYKAAWSFLNSVKEDINKLTEDQKLKEDKKEEASGSDQAAS